MSAKDKQIGGSHYKDMPIQPVEFITRNNLGFLEGCVIKRMCRWQAKGGVQDLRKAIHEIELLIEEQPKQDTAPAEQSPQARMFERDMKRMGLPPHFRDGEDNREANKAYGDAVKILHSLGYCYIRAGDYGDWRLRPEGQIVNTPGKGDAPPISSMPAVTRAPTANSFIPGICVPEGCDLPTQAQDGTRVLVWRPRKPGMSGAATYGWVEIGFMWGGELVPHEANG